ncbi:MAG: hypothetical protein JWN30_825 [Bacilli bacterium]|nr:hypothetical protein [Bacilli bacterium]
MAGILTFLPAVFRWFGMLRGFVGVVQPMFPNLAKWFLRFGSRMPIAAR